ncbi:MAG: hypothetical protein R3A52_10275 [Polyangiales bacterium]
MRSSLLLSAALLSACAATQRPSDARPARRYLRVAEGAVLHTRADDAAPSVTVAGGATFRRVRARGEWIEVETLASARQCAPVLRAPRGIRLRFFVRATSVAPVLAADVTTSGPQGSLSVAPGVALQGRELSHAGLRLTLASAPTSAMEHPAPRPQRARPSGERLAPGTRLALPEGASAEVGRDVPVYVRSRRATGEGARVTVATPCVRFEAVVPDAAVLPAVELDVDARGERAAGARWALRRGARLRWTDGSAAGRVTRGAWLTDEGRVSEGRRCFRVELRVSGGAPGAEPIATEVCADAADLARME